VAHEAAHVIQQRGGVQLKGGVGEAGDAYERQADEVADRVVQGESAEELLGPGRSDAALGHPPIVQMSSEKQDMPGLGQGESTDHHSKKRRRNKLDQKEEKKEEKQQEEEKVENEGEKEQEEKKGENQEEEEVEQKKKQPKKFKKKMTLTTRFLSALDASLSGKIHDGQVYGKSVKFFQPQEGQIVFHGTRSRFKKLKEGQIYLSDFDTALRNSSGRFVMLIEITEPLRLIDLSHEATVRTLLLLNETEAIHQSLGETTGLWRVGNEVEGTFRKGTVGKEDNHLCAWTEHVGYDGFARFPVNKKGFPEIAVHAINPLRVLGHRTQNGKITEYTI